MTRKELLNLVLESESRKSEDLYHKPGLDDTSRLFLHSIKENPQHLQRKKLFRNYTGYEQRY